MLRRLSRNGKDTKDDDDSKSDTSRSTPPPESISRKDSLSRSLLRRGSLPRKGSQSTNPSFEGTSAVADDDKRSSMPSRKGSQVTRNPSFVAEKSVASSSTHSSITRNLGSRVGRIFGRSASSAASQDAKVNRVSRELTASKAASAKLSSGGYESRGRSSEADLQKATRDLKEKYRKTLEEEAVSSKKKGSKPTDKTLSKNPKVSRSKSPSARGLLTRRISKKKSTLTSGASQSSIINAAKSSKSSSKKKSSSSKSSAKREAKERELKMKQRKAMPYPGVMDLTYLGPKETFLPNLGRNPNNLDFGDGPRMVQSRA